MGKYFSDPVVYLLISSSMLLLGYIASRFYKRVEQQIDDALRTVKEHQDKYNRLEITVAKAVAENSIAERLAKLETREKYIHETMEAHYRHIDTKLSMVEASFQESFKDLPRQIEFLISSRLEVIKNELDEKRKKEDLGG